MNPGPERGHTPAGSTIWRHNSDDRSSLRQALVGRPARIASSSHHEDAPQQRDAGVGFAEQLPTAIDARSLPDSGDVVLRADEWMMLRRRSLMLWQRGRNFPSCVHNSLRV
jgi:hypothetical protein